MTGLQKGRSTGMAGEPAVVILCDEFDIRAHVSLDEIAVIWDRLGNQNIFLSSDYLRALHAAPPSTMHFYYLTVWKGERLIGIIYLQLDVFRANRSISYHKDAAIPEAPSGFFRRIREMLVDRIKINTLVCGNTLVTGEHGTCFVEDVPHDKRLRLINVAMHEMANYLSRKGTHVHLLFTKDYFSPATEILEMEPDTRVFHGFHAQPNMIMELSPAWKTFDDYLGMLSSKYRVRTRRAFKKAEGIERRELDADDLLLWKDKIIEYYRDIAENASFNLFILNPDYFVAVKRFLGDRFRVFGFFENGKLIAFYTLMVNGEEVEAHFLGYEEETNKEYQLYHNMLLEMIALCIDLGVRRIIFGRTAMEIKSSVGAEPHLMYFYLQYRNALINQWVPRIYHTLEPEVQWVPRSPFRNAHDD